MLFAFIPEQRSESSRNRVHVPPDSPPSRRVFIPKADGRQRPLGIASIEDKIVQQAVVMVLSAIYEEDFLGFAYGFRLGRGRHDALNALTVGIKSRKVNWILDADIRSFFDEIDHGWMLRFLEHRIADQRVLSLIRKWLEAGVIENGCRIPSTKGTPQGAVISPLLANICLHYAFDQWVQRWRKQPVRGAVVVVRYADDSVMGFQREQTAPDFLADLRERFAKFGLVLHPDKTRLMSSGDLRPTEGGAGGRNGRRRSTSWGSRIVAEQTKKESSRSFASRRRSECGRR
jgi:RNA-directed DNA polymerase